MNRTVFTSSVSFEDAARQARWQGYIVVGQTYNKNTGKYVVFAQPGVVNRMLF